MPFPKPPSDPLFIYNASLVWYLHLLLLSRFSFLFFINITCTFTVTSNCTSTRTPYLAVALYLSSTMILLLIFIATHLLCSITNLPSIFPLQLLYFFSLILVIVFFPSTFLPIKLVHLMLPWIENFNYLK